MNQLLAASEAYALLGVLRRQQVLHLLRAAVFIGSLLIAWISLRPFVNLSEADLPDATSGNDALTYVVFGGLAVLTGLLTISENRRGLQTLLSPGLLIFGGWILISVVLSTDPSVSAKRLTLTASAAAVAGLLKCCSDRACGSCPVRSLSEGATIVCTLTGHGLKDIAAVMNDNPQTVFASPDKAEILSILRTSR